PVAASTWSAAKTNRPPASFSKVQVTASDGSSPLTATVPALVPPGLFSAITSGDGAVTAGWPAVRLVPPELLLKSGSYWSASDTPAESANVPGCVTTACSVKVSDWPSAIVPTVQTPVAGS